jgi:hypothetical protein
VIEEDLTTRISEVEIADQTQDDLLPVTVRSEVNFLQFPFFALSWRNLKEKTKIEYRVTAERKGEKAELVWSVMANAEYGLPTPFDRRVCRAMDALISETALEAGLPLKNPISFTIYRLAALIGVLRGRRADGRTYNKIKMSLERVIVTAIKSSGTFYQKGRKSWLHDVFHLYERVVFVGKELPSGQIAETNYIWLSEPYLASINARYVKPLDYRYLVSLRSDLASRLYELLGVKFYGLPDRKGFLRIGYLNLCQALPINPQRYYSKARESLDPAHQELIDTGFLAKVTYQRVKGKRDFNILYYPGGRAKQEKSGQDLPVGNVEESLLPPLQPSDDVSTGLMDELHARGVSRTTAKKLAEDFPEALVREKIEEFDLLRASSASIKNPAGWLRRSIEDGWEPAEEIREVKERKKRQAAQRDRKERWLKRREELIAQELHDWEKTPDDQRIAGRLQFLTGQFSNRYKTLVRELGSKEAATARIRKELLDGLPKTEQERRRDLEDRYPLDPPPEFV